VNAPLERLQALTRLAQAETPEDRAFALASGVSACMDAASTTIFLFEGTQTVTATWPPGAPAHSLSEIEAAKNGRLLLRHLEISGRRIGTVAVSAESGQPNEAPALLSAYLSVAARLLDVQHSRTTIDERREEAETLERVVRTLRDTRFVDEVLVVFAGGVSHQLSVGCAVYALENDGLVLRVLREHESDGHEPAQRLETSALGTILAGEDPQDASALDPNLRVALFGRSEGTIVPLRLEGTPWGCIVVRAGSRAVPRSFEERGTFFRTLALHLEIALSNARAYERELRRAQDRELLAAAARAILGHTSLEPLSEVMCSLAVSLVRGTSSCVLRWNGDRYEVLSSYGEGYRDAIARSGFNLEQRAGSRSDAQADERRVHRLIDGPGYLVIPLSQSTGTVLEQPMSRASEERGEAIGAFLIVSRPGLQRFERDDLRIMQELGGLLALGLQNIELYEATGKANRALQESSAFKDDLLAMLAHDFKGPLTVILGYCELLMEGSDEHRDVIETVHAQAERLVRLSEDALVLARTQAEGFSLDSKLTDFGAFVQECIAASAPAGERIATAIPEEPIAVELDAARFRHVVDNLLSNALKYSAGQVDVRVRSEGSSAVLEVTDRGIGIPEAELGTLFTRFGRASNAREKGIAGSGIGLYIARKIVEVHRGTLTARSVENKGSTFIVTLPRAGATT
jgi:signal transduction histidine kinase